MSASVEAHDMELNLWVKVCCVVEFDAVVEVEPEPELEVEVEVEVMEILMEGVMEGVIVVEMENVFDTLQYAVWIYCLQVPPISTVSVIIPCVDSIFDVPLLPHPVEAPVVPAVHFSMLPFVTSMSQLSTFHVLFWQPVNLYAAEVDSWQVVIEEEQHID